MAHVFQRPLNARVAPTRILRRHPQDQTPNLREHSWSAWSPPGVGPFPRNQFAMPSQNGVWGDKRRYVSEYGASEPLPKHRETPPLRIVQPQPASRQLGFQRAILLPKKRNHIALLALEPSEQRGEEHLERKHEVSLCQCVARVFRHYGLEIKLPNSAEPGALIDGVIHSDRVTK